MPTVSETSQAAAEQNAADDVKKRFAVAKPTAEMFQHIAATQVGEIGFTVTLLDGTFYRTTGSDFMFTDGLSIVCDGHRIYIPKTSIKTIMAHNPGDKFDDKGA